MGLAYHPPKAVKVMIPWRSHIYSKTADEVGIAPTIISNAVETAKYLHQVTPGAVPVFTLNHLSKLTGTPYEFLRLCVERENPEPYRRFRIHKRSIPGETKKRYRIICVPDPRLMQTQRWINKNILHKGSPHHASVAFGEGNSIKAAVEPHCGCRWLIKIDILNFFESINERQAYHVFNRMGYQPLLSFELARLCTRQGKRSHARSTKRWFGPYYRSFKISTYKQYLLGHLPQGAPSSPMLANLVMKHFDKTVSTFAVDEGLQYTRYADDLTFSISSKNFKREDAKKFILKIYRELRKNGFEPNLTKTKIISPGARKIVLGLLVDGEKPCLTKKYRDNIRQHLHYMNRSDIGPVKHARNRGFISVYGLRNHVQGLIAHADQIDPQFASKVWVQFNKVNWP